MKTKMTKDKLIELALDHCGYDCDNLISRESNLIECFRDYVAGGIFGDLTLEEADDMITNNQITIGKMCKVLLRV